MKTGSETKSTKDTDVREGEIINDRIRIYGSFILAIILVITAAIVGVLGKAELAAALLGGSALPALAGATTAHKKR